MNREEELEARITELETENGELKGRVLVAEKQVEDAKKAVQTYINEIVATGENVKKMLKSTALIQEQSMGVRRRLAKVNMALMAADNLVNAYRTFVNHKNNSTQLLGLEKVYTATREELKKTDAEPTGGQSAGGPDDQAPGDRS